MAQTCMNVDFKSCVSDYQQLVHLDAHDEEHLKTISELQSKLDSANEALIAEQKKASSFCLLFVHG